MSSTETLHQPVATEAPAMLFELKEVSKHFASSMFSSGRVEALRSVSLSIQSGESFGILGETGSGKTTLARLLVGLLTPTSGRILYQGRELKQQLKHKHFRREVQMTLQDPFSALNPTMTVQETVLETLACLRGEKERDKVVATLKQVGLGEEVLSKYPFELSGGQRQRVAIARAIVVEPQVLIADEPVSMLDVSLRASILHLLRSLRKSLQLTLIVIAHDISIFPYLSERLAVLYRGQLVELGKTKSLFSSPLHPYTQMLLKAVPKAEAGYFSRFSIPIAHAESSSPCAFYPLCPKREATCKERVSTYINSDQHLLYCPPVAKKNGFAPTDT